MNYDDLDQEYYDSMCITAKECALITLIFSAATAAFIVLAIKIIRRFIKK